MMSTEDLKKRISPKFTEGVLFDILRKKSGYSEVTVKNINFGPESKKGESYLSTVTKFSVKATGRCEGSNDEKEFEVHVIAKSFPDNIARRKTFRSVDFFATEIAFYDKVWPAMKKFQESKNLKNPFDPVVLCLSTYTDGLDDYIALEDVSFQGYVTLSRGAGLEFEQAKIILRVFAKFHALSLAFKDQSPKEFEEVANSLEETYFAEKFRKWYAGAMKKFCVVARDAVEKHLSESYLKRLDELLAQDLYGEISKICAARGPLAVITHGDCWAPNFLVKYDENSAAIISTIMIDYQLTRCSSLVMDIMFFMSTCLEQRTLTESWHALIEDYHQTLVKFLGDLGSDPSFLTIDLLKEDMKQCGAFGFGMSMEAIIMSLIEDDEIADIDMIEGEEAVPLDSVWIIRPIKNEEKRQRVASFFKNLVDKSII